MCAALAACTLDIPGCTASRSYEVPARAEQAQEDRRDAESRLKVREQEKEKTAQLQKDLDAAKNEARKANQARLEAEDKIKKLEQENADLKKRIPKADSSNTTFTPESK